MKIDRHGRAKILTPEEINLLFNRGLDNNFYRTLFATALFSAARIREVCTLLTRDVYDLTGEVRSHLIIRKGNTKGQLGTRTIPIIPDLRTFLVAHRPEASEPYLFPGMFKGTHINPDSAARVLRKACAKIHLEGISTHSFRRTALTQMSDQGIPLRVIAEYSGHRDLAQLNAYLEVRDEQILGAASSLSMLSPIVQSAGKVQFDDTVHSSTSTDKNRSSNKKKPHRT